jgi:hypothetical protein
MVNPVPIISFLRCAEDACCYFPVLFEETARISKAPWNKSVKSAFRRAGVGVCPSYLACSWLNLYVHFFVLPCWWIHLVEYKSLTWDSFQSSHHSANTYTSIVCCGLSDQVSQSGGAGECILLVMRQGNRREKPQPLRGNLSWWDQNSKKILNGFVLDSDASERNIRGMRRGDQTFS